MVEELRKYFLRLGFNPSRLQEIGDDIQILHKGHLGPIWKEVIERTKPSDFVRHIRFNLLLRSLKNGTKNSIKSKQKDLWGRKIAVEKLCENIDNEIDKHEVTVKDEVQMQNKLKLIALKKSNDVTAIRRKKYFYMEKNKKLKGILAERQLQIQLAQHLISKPNSQPQEVVVEKIIDTLNVMDDAQPTSNGWDGTSKKINITAVCSEYKSASKIQIFDNISDLSLNCGIPDATLLALKASVNEKFRYVNKLDVIEALKSFQMKEIQLITKIISDLNCSLSEKTGVTYDMESEMSKLCAYYVQTCIETEKIQSENDKKETMLSNYFTSISDDKEYQWIYMHALEAGTTAGYEALKTSIQRLQTTYLSHNTQDLNSKLLNKIQNEIENRRATVEAEFRDIHMLGDKIAAALLRFRNILNNFSKNSDFFTSQYQEKAFHKTELNIFNNIPLQYFSDDFSCTPINSSVPALIQKRVPYNTILRIFENPVTQPACVVLDIFKKKLVRHSQDPFLNFGDFPNPLASYSADTFLTFEESVKSFKKSLSNISSDCYQLDIFNQTLTVTVEFWEQQTWKTMVASTRLFNSQNLLFYEKKYEKLFKRLKMV